MATLSPPLDDVPAGFRSNQQTKRVLGIGTVIESCWLSSSISVTTLLRGMGWEVLDIGMRILNDIIIIRFWLYTR